jgi:hypothetical protein
MQFELVSFPHGKAHEEGTPVLLWQPDGKTTVQPPQ